MKWIGRKLPSLVLLVGTLCSINQSWAAQADARLALPRTTDKLSAVKVLERDSRKPLAGLSVEVVATRQIWCIKAPCPQGKQKKWLGVTDAKGVLNFPESLSDADAELVFQALGTDAYASVHAQSKHDPQRRPIILLTRPR